MADTSRRCRRIVADLECQGATVTRGKGGTYKVRAPGGGIVMVHTTPKDIDHWARHLARAIRAAGLNVPPIL